MKKIFERFRCIRRKINLDEKKSSSNAYYRGCENEDPLRKKREISEDYVYTKETEKRDFTTHFLKLPFVRVYNKQIA